MVSDTIFSYRIRKKESIRDRNIQEIILTANTISKHDMATLSERMIGQRVRDSLINGKEVARSDLIRIRKIRRRIESMGRENERALYS